MPNDDFGTLHDKLAHVGAKLLLECAAELSAGTLPRIPQNEHDASYTKPLSKDDLRLDYHRPAHAVVNQIRSLSPRPGAWVPYEGKRLKILEARVAQVEPQINADAGPVFTADGRTFVKTHPGSIEVLRLILEGKKESSGAQFAQRGFEKR
jgi:methionyl-tRNA formyltransferase